MRRRKLVIAAWCLYDWAITPFPTLVTTFIISNYFARAIAPDPTAGSASWSYMVALAGVVIALASPPLGAIADRIGHAKRGIAIASLATVISGGLLWFAKPDPALALPVLITAGVGIVAIELGQLFFNALLPAVAPREMIGRVSGWGWAAGYAGGLVCLAVALLLLINPEQPIFGLSHEASANIRACGPLVALWLIVFGWPLFPFVPDLPRTRMGVGEAIREGFAELRRTVTKLRAVPGMTQFLIASALYRDGITTILTIGGLYAGTTFGMDFTELVTFGIGLQVTAGLGAAGFAWLDDAVGSKRTIVLSLVGLIGFGAAIIAIRDKTLFFYLSLALGIFIGPAQSASRSMVVRLSPDRQIGQFFGLYALTGRAATFIGPALFGWVTTMAHSQRAGLTVVLMLLIIGLVLLLAVREPNGDVQRDIQR